MGPNASFTKYHAYLTYSKNKFENKKIYPGLQNVPKNIQDLYSIYRSRKEQGGTMCPKKV